MTDEPKISCCETCGSAVSVEGSLTGTRYYVPINGEFLERLMDKNEDDFIRDRLRRCERIVTDLRQQVRDFEKNQ